MAYNDYEISRAAAKPLEMYKFIGTKKNYLYTSCDVDVTVTGELYTAAPIKRNNSRIPIQDDEQLTLEIEMPFTLELIKDYAFTSAPPTLELEIWRIHWGMNFAADAVKVYSGPVLSFSIDGVHAKAVCASTFTSILSTPLPIRYWQKPCNHVLFDGRCGINAVSYTSSATVGIFDGIDIHVDDDGNVDGALVAGEMINARSGEHRMIISNIANLVTVNFPFNDLVTGDEVTLKAGCDHSFTTCKAKFANTINYGGHPFIPNDNPFSGAL
jgi:uncharacterized phage protein (TIGR02218 family)